MNEKNPVPFVLCAAVNFASTAHIVSRTLALGGNVVDFSSWMWCLWVAGTLCLLLLSLALLPYPEPEVAGIASFFGLGGIAAGEVWFRNRPEDTHQELENDTSGIDIDSGSESGSEHDPYSVDEIPLQEDLLSSDP